MSENIPESIPTSADPRSKRPLKKRVLATPTSAQAASLEVLFSKPDQEVVIPSSSTSSKPYNVSQPPEIVANVQGSSAGAGSGEFHVYKASRRREYERLRAMDEEVKKEEEGERWEREKREREERDAEVTRKKREKRARKGKGNKGGKGEEKKAPIGGGLKPRVIAASAGVEVAADGNGEEQEGKEEVGVIIHDDD
ncbi:hypothetical protein B0O99DRAFT_618804 [Bisporella sp. PMI_857]|nr:hypothetical protein B0O99DRAFT_618804 [Bisporella sp. PMI_857]